MWDVSEASDHLDGEPLAPSVLILRTENGFKASDEIEDFGRSP